MASLRWLGLDHDEGPIYQMQRLDRYAEVVAAMLAAGSAYRCYATPAELEAMREAQRARGEKTLYDGRWRPEPGKTLPPVPEGVAPVIRFRNPQQGVVTWDDMVKGPITIANHEIDDLVIVRADGIPTYNFAVVVDDWDMGITHVFRGDEHVNNTPWQINIFHALGAPLPVFAHVPIILGNDGLKLSKRRGAVSVTAYEESGYLPEAMLNYLARLGWSHGDEELFSRAQMVAWFDGGHLSKSPAQWDPAKLDWVNAHYLKALDAPALIALARAQLARRGIAADDDARLLRAARGLQGPLQHRRRAGRLARRRLRRRHAERRGCRAACHRGGPAGAAGLRREAGDGRMEQGRDRERDQGDARRDRAEDAAAGAGGAGSRLRPGPDAVARRGARGIRARDRARPPARGLGRGAGRRGCAGYNLGFRWRPTRPARQARTAAFRSSFDGGIAQLGERLHGMQEVSGSIPLTSTRWVEAGPDEPASRVCSPLRLEA